MGSEIHWQAPVTIVVTFILGLLFAIAHHVFYDNLNGKLVIADDRLFSQQINIAIGTAFAFLFRASLSVSIAVTYWQVFWGQVLRKGKAFPVAHLDSLAGLLASIFEFTNIRALSSAQGLALLASLSWLIPLATLLPPATLAVEIVFQIQHASVDVPFINFTSDALMTEGMIHRSTPVIRPTYTEDESVYEPEPTILSWTKSLHYFKPGSASPRLIQLLTSVAMDQAIPSFRGVGVNTTYELQFAGPALQCRSLPDDDLQKFRSYMDHDCTSYAITKGIDGETLRTPVCGMDRAGLIYMSWLSRLGYFWDDMRPSFAVKPGGLQADVQVDEVGWFGESRSFMVATRFYDPEVKKASQTLTLPYRPWEVLNCSLHHAVYTANITSSASNVSDVGEFDVKLLEAVARPSPAEGTINDSNYTNAIPPSTLPGAAVNGYMAMVSGFFNTIQGHIRDPDDRGPQIESDVRRTILMYTRELLQYTVVKPIKGGDESGTSWWALTDAERSSDNPYPEEAFDSPVFNQSLGSAIEDVFQRMTLSLLSNPLFVQKTDQPTDAAINSWPNVYTYRQSNLLISYGIALFLALLSCGFGCTTIYLNGLSYSGSLSTTLRVTRGHLEGFDPLLADQDQNGADPLPRHLAVARIHLGETRLEEQSVDDEKSHIAGQHKQSETSSERNVTTTKQGINNRASQSAEEITGEIHHDSREQHSLLRTSEDPREENTTRDGQ